LRIFKILKRKVRQKCGRDVEVCSGMERCSCITWRSMMIVSADDQRYMYLGFSNVEGRT